MFLTSHWSWGLTLRMSLLTLEKVLTKEEHDSQVPPPTGHPPERERGPIVAAAAGAVAVAGPAAWAGNVRKQVILAPAGAVQ